MSLKTQTAKPGTWKGEVPVKHRDRGVDRSKVRIKRPKPSPAYTANALVQLANIRNRLSWCPKKYRKWYTQVRNQVGALEARRIIEDHIQKRGK